MSDCPNSLDLYGDLKWAAARQNPTKWSVCPAKTQISLGIRPVWSESAVHMKKHWVLSCPLSSLCRLIRLGGCPGWPESLLGAHVILLVLLCGGSNSLEIEDNMVVDLIVVNDSFILSNWHEVKAFRFCMNKVWYIKQTSVLFFLTTHYCML